MRITSKQFNAIFVLTGSLLLLACSGEKNHGDQQLDNGDSVMAPGLVSLTEEQIIANDFTLGSFEEKSFHQSVKATGMMEVPPESRIAISPYLGGYVKELPLLTGQNVKKGETLLVLENPQFIQLQEDLLEAKGQLAYLESDFRRQEGLAKSKVSSEKKFRKAEADYKVMKARYEALRKKLGVVGIDPDQLAPHNITSMVKVYAPISGTVTTIQAQRGIFLEPSDVALTLVNTEDLHLELRVFEKDAWKIREGQQVTFRLQDNPSKEYSGTVHLVGRAVDPVERSIGLHVHFDPSIETSNWIPGMYAEAFIRTESVQRPGLPIEAVVRAGNEHYVLLQAGTFDGRRRFVKKRVETGSTENGFMEVKNAEDFEKNAVFLTKGAFNLIKE
ncbi:efflux RND transporter periplasmic adaptor subunit [Echinicola vietnamensis]|uniref:RND family efflux transporter, MFP subunit n=1 Tax=Echinicola vietnamensis (strain DSM 17526 / LMG 23754 / KMM 6221) TaxID=926556 RepID=L0G5X9_ECHVK|nr:efflux RND transporter periplasmic adaptor subunit [Echinicola vietnamensis]AGA80406.1 RND family efflux transporter, MFP subunit [Echinicola vietnamensis DSM 17526]